MNKYQARINKKVVHEGDCHIWTAFTNRGYPAMRYEGGTRRVSLIIAELEGWDVPEDMHVFPGVCLNKLCVAPAHLQVMSRLEWNELNAPEAEDIFWSNVDKGSDCDCWEWTGVNNKGTHPYGVFYRAGTKHVAHRFSVELHGREIPEGLVVDHLCRNTLCVNPSHLDIVTNSENVKRGHALKTHCKAGHELSEDNVYVSSTTGWRQCKICVAERNKKYTEARKKGESGTYNGDKTHCVHGHEFTEENTYTRRTGGRDCRQCRRDKARAYYHAASN